MTPVQTTPILERSPDANRARPTGRPVLLTRSETEECNCPEHCERDHEVD